MAITLSPKTEALIRERLEGTGFSSVDEFVQAAVTEFSARWEDLDEETQAAISEGLDQIERGEVIPIEEAVANLEARAAERRKPSK